MDGNWNHDSKRICSSISNKNVVGSRRSSSTTADSDEDAGEAGEEESESSSLEIFRKEWEAEIKHQTHQKNNTPITLSTNSRTVSSSTPTYFSSKSSPTAPASVSPRNVDTPASGLDKIEEEAKRLFLMGVSFERRGDLYDAVRFYRRATQLIPDIENRVMLQTQTESYEFESSVVSDDIEIEENFQESNSTTGNDEEEDSRPLYLKFIQKIEANRWKFLSKQREESKCHISDLPVELLLYILRWVVSSDLDVRSLDVLAKVCRGFYCLCRDEDLWKMACGRVWSSCDILGSEFSSYREMFLSRPRVRYDGCYISRITYVRPGEHSFQDASYRPWHIVEYFRYLRFYPDGRVYFLTTAEKPAVTVGTLRDNSSSRNTALLKGNYRLFGNNVISATVRKFSNPTQPQSAGGRGKSKQPQQQEITEFHMDFEIEEMKRKKHWVLKWTYYAIFINNLNVRANNNLNNDNNGNRPNTGITTTFDLSPGKYPPLYFSRVKSYTLNSESILK